MLRGSDSGFVKSKSLPLAALVDKEKETDATYLYFGKVFYIFLCVIVLFYLYKCANLLAKVLLNIT